MRSLWTPILVIGLLVAVVCLPFAVRLARSSSLESKAVISAGSDQRLVIVSPHTESIRYEFARAFNAYRVAHRHAPVDIDWRSGGGTSDLVKMIQGPFEVAAKKGKEDDGIGIDLFFGGGDYSHNLIVDGVRIERDGQKEIVRIVDPLPFTGDEMHTMFPADSIGGEKLYRMVDFDHDGSLDDVSWVGAALSSFGIVYNRDVLRDVVHAPEPRVWSDLAKPELRGWVALADPGHSASVSVTFDTVLRRKGWDGGWFVLRRAFANARYFAKSSSQVPVDVSNGQAAAGMCIGFYGRSQEGFIEGSRVGYVDPPLMTSITADPITLLRGAPSQKRARAAGRSARDGLAFAFVQFVMSPTGQGLWQRRVGEPDGPEKFELRRMPVRQDMYSSEEMSHWRDGDVKPFEIARPMPKGMPSFYRTIELVSHAMAIDIHDDCAAAWNAICAETDSTRRAQMLALFDAMPPELQVTLPAGIKAEEVEAIVTADDDPRLPEVVKALDAFSASFKKRWVDRDERTRDRLAWTAFFRGNYRRIVAMSRE